jgi:hypothetical protein
MCPLDRRRFQPEILENKYEGRRMKTLALLAIALAAGGITARAQDFDQSFSTNSALWRAEHPLYVLPSSSVNEIRRGRYVYSGLAVDIIKQKNPLQVLNPYSPCNNTGTDNLARDLSGKPIGWTIFSIKF